MSSSSNQSTVFPPPPGEFDPANNPETATSLVRKFKQTIADGDEEVSSELKLCSELLGRLNNLGVKTTQGETLIRQLTSATQHGNHTRCMACINDFVQATSNDAIETLHTTVSSNKSETNSKIAAQQQEIDKQAAAQAKFYEAQAKVNDKHKAEHEALKAKVEALEALSTGKGKALTYSEEANVFDTLDSQKVTDQFLQQQIGALAKTTTYDTYVLNLLDGRSYVWFGKGKMVKDANGRFIVDGNGTPVKTTRDGFFKNFGYYHIPPRTRMLMGDEQNPNLLEGAIPVGTHRRAWGDPVAARTDVTKRDCRFCDRNRQSGASYCSACSKTLKI